MKILFVTKDGTLDEDEFDLAHLLVHNLKERNHMVVWRTPSSESLPDANSFRKSERWRDMDGHIADWDILLAQDVCPFSLEWLDLQPKQIPVVQLAYRSNGLIPTLCHPNLWRVVTFDNGDSLVDWGLAPELVSFIPEPACVEPRFVTKSRSYEPQVLCAMNSVERNPSLAHSFISAANRIARTKFMFWADDLSAARTKLGSIANSNVHFVSTREGLIQALFESDVVVASGRVALKAVIASKPTIVAGPRGFGGHVTHENINEFQKRRFMGRFGGEQFEEVPISLLSYEITALLSQREHEDSETRPLLNLTLGVETPVTEILIPLLEDIVDRNRQLHDCLKLPLMKPRLASNCVISSYASDGGWYQLARKPTGTVIADVDQGTVELLRLLDGTRCIKEVLAAGGISGKDNLMIFEENIRRLWQAKALIV